MAASTEADLKELPAIYRSSRLKWELLLGEDPVAAVVTSILANENDAETLRSLLRQQPWTEVALEKRHTIYGEYRPAEDDSGVRQVFARPMSHLERVFNIASEHNKPEAISALLDSASKTEGVELPSLIGRQVVYRAILNGYTSVIEAMTVVDPDVAHLQIHHGNSALDCAVSSRRTDIIALFLKHGAKPSSGLIRRPAGAGMTRAVEMLVQHGASVNGTGALHQAAHFGHLDVMHVLFEHSADVDEILPPDYSLKGEKGRNALWTPMHFAAARGQVGAMKLLESKGSRSADVKDANGKTPAQLLAEHKLGRSLEELVSVNTDASTSLTGDAASGVTVQVDEDSD